MRVIAGMIFLWLSSSTLSAEGPRAAQEMPPSCSHTISRCEVDAGSPVCRLMTSQRVETHESVIKFLKGLASFPSEVQKEFVCARLMGRRAFRDVKVRLLRAVHPKKRKKSKSHEINGQQTFTDTVCFENISSEYYLSNHNRGYERESILRFCLPNDDPHLAIAVEALQRLRMMGRSTAGHSVELDLIGIVDDVKFTYHGTETSRRLNGKLRTSSISLRDVFITGVSSPLYQGSRPDFSSVAEALLEERNRVYEEIMNLGLPQPASPPAPPPDDPSGGQKNNKNE